MAMPIRMLQTVTARFGRIFKKRRGTEGLRAAVAISDTEIAVALVLVEGFAYKEAAEILEIPMGTLTSRLVRGREALMARLGEAA